MARIKSNLALLNQTRTRNMPYITFLKSLRRDDVTIDLIKQALDHSEVIYLQTSRSCADWIRSKIDMEGVVGHAFFSNDGWEELIVNLGALGGSLQDLNAPVGLALAQWAALGEPDRHTAHL